MSHANKSPLLRKLTSETENAWLRIGTGCPLICAGLLAETLGDADKALFAFDRAIRQNPHNIKALTQSASICRLKEQYSKVLALNFQAVEYFQRILNLETTNGEIWAALGHCYLMMEELHKAYSAYQQALYHLPNPKDSNLWYGIGILYDRYGSLEHAEEAFTAVLKMDPQFEKGPEIYFRLGVLYKQQMKYEPSLECFRYILQHPPRPLTQSDVWFQIGHVFELQRDFQAAKDTYERVLWDSPNHSKVLQQLGWLYHSNTSFANQQTAIKYLAPSRDVNPADGQTWYILGRCYMSLEKYRKAYDAFQQAVYRDGRNPSFWCSIGVLYCRIHQYRDALDAFSRAIRLNPYLSEVWYDLGTLYETCNQLNDSRDAYQRAAELDPNNSLIQKRLKELQSTDSNPETEKPSEPPMVLEPRTASSPPGPLNSLVPLSATNRLLPLRPPLLQVGPLPSEHASKARALPIASSSSSEASEKVPSIQEHSEPIEKSPKEPKRKVEGENTTPKRQRTEVSEKNDRKSPDKRSSRRDNAN